MKQKDWEGMTTFVDHSEEKVSHECRKITAWIRLASKGSIITGFRDSFIRYLQSLLDIIYKIANYFA